MQGGGSGAILVRFREAFPQLLAQVMEVGRHFFVLMNSIKGKADGKGNWENWDDFEFQISDPWLT